MNWFSVCAATLEENTAIAKKSAMHSQANLESTFFIV